MKTLSIKTFMTDSRRPTWLIELLWQVNAYCPKENIDNPSEVFNWITSTLREVRYVKRNAEYKAIDCVRVEETTNTLTLFTLYKDKPLVEFRID